MKQVLRRGIKEIVVDDVPAPALAPHHVLVQPAYSLISSGTESSSIHSEGAIRTVSEHPEHLAKIWKAFKEHGPKQTLVEIMAKFQEYSILGYAGAGTVAEKHSSVKDLSIGDRVAYGGEGTGHGEYILASRNYVARIPEGVPFSAACFTTLGSIALNAVRTAQIGIGDVVVVEGLGLVGQLISQLARLQGGIVIGTDLRERRLELAQKLGAHHIATADGAATHVVGSVTNGRGADCVIIAAASKSPAPAHQALELCRERGRIVVVGSIDVSFPWEHMYLKEIKVLMARAYGAGCYDTAYEREGRDYPYAYVRWTANRNMEEFLRIVARGQVQLEPLISHEYPIAQAAQAYETMMNPATHSLAVVLRYPEREQVKTLEHEVSRLQRAELRSSEIKTAHKPSKSNKLNVAVVGAGNLARWVHLPVLKKLSGVNVRAIVSKNGARGKGYAVRFGAEYCTTDYEEMLRDQELDLVVIASRNADHCTQAVSALRAGKHVFVEKPMAISNDECRLLWQEAESSDSQFTIGFNRRFAPVYVQMKEHLSRRSGPAVINCRVNSPGISGSYWMADPEIGGALVGEGCHFVDLMYWLLESEPICVSAFSLPKGKKDIVGENNVVGSFLFADGSIGNLTYTTIGHMKSGGERVEVFAPGIAAWAEDFKRLKVAAASRTTRTFLFPQKGYSAQMNDFIESVRNRHKPKITLRDGARATLACLRMLDSARTLEPCPIDLQSISTERPFATTVLAPNGCGIESV